MRGMNLMSQLLVVGDVERLRDVENEVKVSISCVIPSGQTNPKFLIGVLPSGDHPVGKGHWELYLPKTCNNGHGQPN